MKSLSNKSRISLLAGVLAMAVFAVWSVTGFNFASAAWQEPIGAPPTNNVAAPLNVGSTAQTKSGDLTVANLNSGNNVVLNGSLCFDGLTDCRSTWAGSELWTAGTGNNIYRLNGNVGIGLTSPNFPLHVSGSANGANINLIKVSNTAGTTAGTEAGIYFAPTVSATGRGAKITGYQAGANQIGLKFYVGYATDAATEVMYLNPSGKVSIGTSALVTDGNTKIQVSGGDILLDNNRALKAKRDDGTGISNLIWADPNKYVVIGENTTYPEGVIVYTPTDGGGFDVRGSNGLSSALFVNNEGKVGIGTRFASEKLEVYSGNVLVYDGEVQVKNSGEIGFDSLTDVPGSNPGSVRFRSNITSNDWYIWQDEGTINKVGDLFFSSETPNGGYERVVFARSGNVGIGVNNPGSKLEVAGDVKANSFCIGTDCRTSWTAVGDNLGNHTATTNLNINNYEVDNVNYLDFRQGVGYGVRFWSNNAYAINMGNTAEFRYGPVTDYSIKMNMSNTSGRGWVWGVDGVVPVAALNTTGNMQIAGSFTGLGKALVGGSVFNSDANTKLQVSGGDILLDNNRALKAVRDDGGGVANLVWADSNRYVIIGESTTYPEGVVVKTPTDAGNGFDVRKSNGTDSALFVRNDGNVGVGTTAPERQLQLDQSMKIGTGSVSSYADEKGIYWNTNSDYGLYKTAGSWTSPNYQQLYMKWRTGIVLDPGSGQYGKSHVGVVGGMSIGSSYYATEYNDGLIVQGNVGIGTTAPSQKLEVVGAALIKPDSTWDGTDNAYLYLGDNNHYIKGSNSGRGEFKSYNGIALSTSEGEKMTILQNGNVGIGTVSPSKALTVNGEIMSQKNSGEIMFWRNNTGVNDGTPDYGIGISSVDLGGGTAKAARISDYYGLILRAGNIDAVSVNKAGNVGIGTNSPGTYKLYVNGTGYLNAAAWVYSSDARLKENVNPLAGSALAKVLQLEPVSFDYINGDKNEVGFIAQDVQEVLPELVSEQSDGMLGLKTTNLIPYLTKAIQEQQQQIDELKQQIQELRATAAPSNEEVYYCKLK